MIPARGGSKGIPRKNIFPLCGRPLVAYSIVAALQARAIERLIVSTDDAAIAEVSQVSVPRFANGRQCCHKTKPRNAPTCW